MKTALMFSCQGTQYPGMMGNLFETYNQTKEVFDKASALLGRDIYGLTMNEAQEELNQTENTQPCLLACELAALRDPQVDLVMNATGRPAADATEIKENLICQLSQPVLFQQSIEYLLGEGYGTFIEIGPGKTLSGMVKRTAKQAGRKVQILQLNSAESVEKIRALL